MAVAKTQAHKTVGRVEAQLPVPIALHLSLPHLLLGSDDCVRVEISR